MVKIKRTLYVIPTNYHELWLMWEVQPPDSFLQTEIFIRCNQRGVINWEKNPVYTISELETRKHQIVTT